MKMNNLSLVFFAGIALQFNSAHAENNVATFHSSVEMLGSSHLHYDPIFLSQLDGVAPANRARRAEESTCNVDDIDLLNFEQWQQEKGYWIGTYTFLGGNGKPMISSSWNYPYGDYKGFITGEVVDNAYRQRNVFLYPPQDTVVCDTTSNATIGEGVCGVNGNTKIFSADQQVTVCTEESLKGTIDGLYFGMFPTKTTLIGDDNALLYQVFMQDGSLVQSQLTTITENSNKELFRTRSAQGFYGGVSNSVSYYRERKVTEEEFFKELESSIADYNILTGDLCNWDAGNNPVPGGGSLQACKDHLNESFELEADLAATKFDEATAQPTTQPSTQPTTQPSVVKISKKSKGAK